MTEEAVQQVLDRLNARRCAEFRTGGERYLIQPDNNKGCDYLSIWRTSAMPERLGYALYDAFDGVDADTVRELLELPCICGESCRSLLAAGKLQWE